MRSTLERLIADFLATDLPAAVPRDVRPLTLDRKADVYVGMRRSGKTFAMFDAMQRLLDQGVDRELLLYVNLDDDRLVDPDTSTLSEAIEAYFRLSPLARERGSYLFLDEIQVIPGWEQFARRVLDTENAHLFLGGSSSKLLSTEVATTFRGRGFTTEVLPYGFREYARALSSEPSQKPGHKQAAALSSLADRYLVEGGFPETVGMPALARTQTLQGYAEMVAMRDVIERHGIENTAALKRLISGVFAANASQFSVSSFAGALRSQGFKTTKPTLYAYIDHLIDAYLFFMIPIDSRSEKARLVNPRKVYAIDTGLAAAMYAGGSLNYGALLENAVYLELRRRLGPLANGAIAFHRTASGREVDFVVDSPLPPGGRHFFQVCWSLEGDEAVERESAALTEALAANPGASAILVSRLDSGEFQTPAGTIEIVPFWEWALRTDIL